LLVWLFSVLEPVVQSQINNFDQNDEHQILNLNKTQYKNFPINLLEKYPQSTTIIANNCSLKSITSLGNDTDVKFLKITRLDLQSNEITVLEPKTFSSLSNLKYLVLTKNKIESIEINAFYGLESLQHLFLSSNKLQTIDTSTFSMLSSLTQINLDENKLIDFNLNCFSENYNLKSVNLNKNKIEHLRAFADNQVIEEIFLNYNMLADIMALGKMQGMITLSLNDCPNLLFNEDTFTDMVQLRKLYLEKTNLQSLENDFTVFKPLINLRYLHIGRNSLDILYFSELPVLPNLFEFSLSENRLSELDVRAMNKKLPKLRKIDICHNNWNCEDLRNIIAYLNGFNVRLPSKGCKNKDEESEDDQSDDTKTEYDIDCSNSVTTR
jgi:Leucine-rich repeat (LRR) protein